MGTMEDAQAIMRHKHIKTTAGVYMDHIPESYAGLLMDAQRRFLMVTQNISAAHERWSIGLSASYPINGLTGRLPHC